MRQCKQCGATFFYAESFCTYCGEQVAPGAQREEPRQSRRDSYSRQPGGTDDWDFFAFKQAFSQQSDTPPPINMFRRSRVDTIIAAVLAFVLGTFGVHWFFLGRRRRGILYAVFFWTGVPTILGIIDGMLLLGGFARDRYFGAG